MYPGPDVVLGMWQHLDIDWVLIGVLTLITIYTFWGTWNDPED